MNKNVIYQLFEGIFRIWPPKMARPRAFDMLPDPCSLATQQRQSITFSVNVDRDLAAFPP
jgi:hypothetical protein